MSQMSEPDPDGKLTNLRIMITNEINLDGIDKKITVYWQHTRAASSCRYGGSEEAWTTFSSIKDFKTWFNKISKTDSLDILKAIYGKDLIKFKDDAFEDICVAEKPQRKLNIS